MTFSLIQILPKKIFRCSSEFSGQGFFHEFFQGFFQEFLQGFPKNHTSFSSSDFFIDSFKNLKCVSYYSKVCPTILPRISSRIPASTLPEVCSSKNLFENPSKDSPKMCAIMMESRYAFKVSLTGISLENF